MSETSPEGRTESLRLHTDPVRVLVVDDDPVMNELLITALSYEGWEARGAENGQEAVKIANELRPDVVVLDVLLPDSNGLMVLKEIRENQPRAPILLLSATDRYDTEERLAGLTSLGDDYVTKPFSLEGLIARIRRLIRRSTSAVCADSVLRVDDLVLDEGSREVSRGGESISLTSTEFEVLRYLMRNASQVASRVDILSAVWMYDFGGQVDIVKLCISRLRYKIDSGRQPIIHIEGDSDYLIKSAVQ